MLSLREQIDALRKLGYGADTAQAKVVHNVVLLAMHRSGFKANSTIKGGVVMSSLTGDVRRATMDMDIDFIRYSLGKSAVAKFVRKLARAIPELELKMIGEPIELKHEDYRGKRIYLAVKDASVARWIRTKVDIGVHTREAAKKTRSLPSATVLPRLAARKGANTGNVKRSAGRSAGRRFRSASGFVCSWIRKEGCGGCRRRRQIANTAIVSTASSCGRSFSNRVLLSSKSVVARNSCTGATGTNGKEGLLIGRLSSFAPISEGGALCAHLGVLIARSVGI